MTSRVALGWLSGSSPCSACGVSWGVPWPQGTIASGASLALLGQGNEDIPVQTWPLAYWPDGSLKWTGHAVSVPAPLTGPLWLTPRVASLGPQTPVRVTSDADAITVDTGAAQCRISRTGSDLIESLSLDGRIVARAGRLVCLREDRSRYATDRIVREEAFVSRVDSVSVEQSGSVRAVVKVQGMHYSEEADRAWLPFTLRLYFYAGIATVRMVHSFVFDGDPETDYVRGLGIRFTVPLREELHNRHVRLAGQETGLFAEPIRVIAGRYNPSAELYAQQIAGQPIPPLKELPRRDLIAQMAAWGDFKLAQLSPDSFRIQKRTGAHSAWIDAWSGTRSLGTAFIGDTTGGLAIGQKDFWQLAPTALEIGNATTDAAEITAWLWSPDAPAMDMRHYDIEDHGLDASYEDIEPGFSTATGIARTTELVIRPYAQVPPNDDLLAFAQETAQPPHLICTPEYYHSIPVFGVWSLPDRSTPAKAQIEAQLDRAIAYYQGQIEQRCWYGFWDYGDVMHSYDPARHQWRYDIGGFAWANTELMPDMWLWLSFLRTGRADIFRMAEAMTRHTQEVDVYHSGPFAGLGSRHNVRHWGCSAKEIRISQAALKRYYYYLTTDERTGDLIDEVTDADFRLVTIDPLRKIEPKTEYPTHMRVGPDWFAAIGNWMTAWERTGDNRYREKIVTGMRCMVAMPHKIFSGDSYGYDPESGKLYLIHDKVAVPHLAALMGGPEVCMELTPLIDLPEWTETWLHYCRYLQAPEEEQRAALGGTVSYGSGSHYARMTAYAARHTGDADLAARAWQSFLRPSPYRGAPYEPYRVEDAGLPIPIEEIAQVSTNDTAQWCLNAIELLELIGDSLPEPS